MPNALKISTKGSLEEKDTRVSTPTSWTAPSFDEANTFCKKWFKEGTESYFFGRFNNIQLRMVLSTYVICFGSGEEDLFGEGTLNLVLSPHVTQNIRVFVLGSIVGTGTAVLLDDQGGVWLYHVPDSLDCHLKGMDAQAALVMQPGDVMTADKEIVFFKEYPHAHVEKTELPAPTPLTNPATMWTPPSFHEGFEFCRNMYKQPFPFGNFNDAKLEVQFSGYIECWGNGSTDLFGEGVLELIIGLDVRQLIRVFVLGNVLYTGTAVLLDEQGNVWLYRTPNSVNPQVPTLIPRAAMVMYHGDVMNEDTKITLWEEYDDAFVEIDQLGPG